jgi:hypothetical protein
MIYNTFYWTNEAILSKNGIKEKKKKRMKNRNSIKVQNPFFQMFFFNSVNHATIIEMLS